MPKIPKSFYSASELGDCLGGGASSRLQFIMTSATQRLDINVPQADNEELQNYVDPVIIWEVCGAAANF